MSLFLILCLFNKENDYSCYQKIGMTGSFSFGRPYIHFLSKLFLSFQRVDMVMVQSCGLIGRDHLIVAFAPCDVRLMQAIEVSNQPRYHCGPLEPNLQPLVPVSVVLPLPMLAIFRTDMIVPSGLALMIAVPKQQYHPTRTTVLVPRHPLDA